jgi:hypothetical protein
MRSERCWPSRSSETDLPYPLGEGVGRERLLEEILAHREQSAAGHLSVGVAGHEQHRYARPQRGEPFGQLPSAPFRIARSVTTRRRPPSRRASRPTTSSFDPARRGRSHRPGAGGGRPMPERQSAACRSWNAAPRPGALSASRYPPLCRTIPYTMESPSPVPVPSGFVVKNGSKARSATYVVRPECAGRFEKEEVGSTALVIAATNAGRSPPIAAVTNTAAKYARNCSL